MLRYLNKFKAYYSFIPSISSNFKTSNSETFNYTSLVKIKLTKYCKKKCCLWSFPDVFKLFPGKSQSAKYPSAVAKPYANCE